VFFSAPHLLAPACRHVDLRRHAEVTTGAVVVLCLVIAGDGRALLAWCAGAVFIPALACTRRGRSGKAFEAVYTDCATP
jgi:hypothetical protein